MILSYLFGKEERHGDRVTPGVHISELAWRTGQGLAGNETASGIEIDAAVALTYSALFGAVKVISEDIASCPAILYRRKANGGRERATDHPLYHALHNEPNEDMTASSYFQTGQGHLLLWGNHYAEIEIRRDSYKLLNRRPDRVTPKRDHGGRLFYEFTNPGREATTLRPEKVLHVAGYGWNGVQGFSPIDLARETIGMGLQMERFGASFFGRGATYGGFLEHPGPEALSEPAYERLRLSIEQESGAGKAHGWKILEEGMKAHPYGVPPENAQFLESRRFGVLEVCRWLRLNPNKLQDFQDAGDRANVEQGAIAHVRDCLRPWFIKWEQEITRKLLTPAERREFYVEFLLDAMLRGDSETRAKVNKERWQVGARTPNEGRRLENEDPIEHELANEPWFPVNYLPISKVAGTGAPLAMTERQLPDGTRETRVEFSPAAKAVARPDKSERSLQARWNLQRAFLRIFQSAAVRMLTPEVKRIRAALEEMPTRGEAAFRQWLVEFYLNHRAFVESVMRDPIVAYLDAVAREAIEEVGGDPDDLGPRLEVFQREYAETFARRYTGSQQAQLEKILAETPDLEEAQRLALERVQSWEDNSPVRIATRETTQGNGAVSKLVYVLSGIRLLRWVWNGGECKICPRMHGRVVEIEKSFAVPGDIIEPTAEGVTPLRVEKITGHPPLHGGCQCGVAAEAG